MCVKCTALNVGAEQGGGGSHLTHPRDPSKLGLFDVYGFAKCPDPQCLTLWYRDVAESLTAVASEGFWLMPRRPTKRLRRDLAAD